MLLETAGDYIEFAGDEFVLFAGSWASNKGSIAPVVPNIRLELFLQMKEIIDNDPQSPVAAKYITEIVTSALQNENPKGTFVDANQIRASITKIKYEEMMRRMSDLHGSPSFIDDFIKAVYHIEPDKFNANHAAMAYLLKSGHCYCILTTNFDTGIENACHAIGFNPRIITLKDAENLHLEDLKGVIFKLHGCANLGDVVANSTAFHHILEGNYFSILKNVVEQFSCLTFGYSGYGDIDISPHLRQSKIDNLAWGNREPAASPFKGSHVAVFNLDSHNASENFLLGLAEKFGWTFTAGAENSQFEKKLHHFLETECQKDYILDVFLELSLMYNQESMSLLYWFGNDRKNWVRNERCFTKSPRLLNIPLNHECQKEIAQYRKSPDYQDQWKYFIEWRIGDGITALNQLWEKLQKIDSSNEEGRFIIAKSSQIILGIIAEELWFLSPRKRTHFLEQYLDQVHYIKELSKEPWWKDIETIDLYIQRSVKFIEIEYAITMDKSRAIEKITKQFEFCLDLELFSVIINVLYTAWLIDRKLGDEFYRKSDKARTPTSEIIAVGKKTKAHRRYNLRFIGRPQFYFWENTVLYWGEIVYDFKYRRLGKKAHKEIIKWNLDR